MAEVNVYREEGQGMSNQTKQETEQTAGRYRMPVPPLDVDWVRNIRVQRVLDAEINPIVPLLFQMQPDDAEQLLIDVLATAEAKIAKVDARLERLRKSQESA